MSNNSSELLGVAWIWAHMVSLISLACLNLNSVLLLKEHWLRDPSVCRLCFKQKYLPLVFQVADRDTASHGCIYMLLQAWHPGHFQAGAPFCLCSTCTGQSYSESSKQTGTAKSNCWGPLSLVEWISSAMYHSSGRLEDFPYSHDILQTLWSHRWSFHVSRTV